LEAKEIIFLFILLVSVLFDIAYFFPIVYHSFFKKSKDEKDEMESDIQEAPMLMVVPIAVCAILVILLGISPNAFVHFFEIASLATKSILGTGG
jgi:multicomponent Na+:H+ antiporter subunit D